MFASFTVSPYAHNVWIWHIALDIASRHCQLDDTAYARSEASEGVVAGPIRKLSMIGAFAAVATGCGSSDTPVAATTPSTMPSLSTAAATTTTVPRPDPALVQDCVAYVQFGAFTGNALLSGMWEEAGASVETLLINCGALGIETLTGMSAQWQDIQEFIAAGNVDSSTTMVP
jgi:hypothetical protein